MIYLSLAVAISGILFSLFVVPRIIPDEMMIEKSGNVWYKLIGAAVFLVLFYFMTGWLEPYYGYDIEGLRFMLAGLLLSSLILLASFIETRHKIKTYYHRTYNKLMLETSGAQKALEESKKQLAEADSRGMELLELEEKLELQKVEIQQKDDLLASLESSLESRKQKIESKEAEVDNIIQRKVTEQRTRIESDYRQKSEIEYEELKTRYNEKMVEFVDSVTSKMEQRIIREKQDLVDDVFSFEGESADDMFELKKAKEGLQVEKDEVEKSKFLLDIDQRVSKANEHMIDAKKSALDVKSENVDLRSELKLMASDFKMDLTKEQHQREKSEDKVMHQLELEQERRQADYRAIGDKLAVMDAQTKAQMIEIKSSLLMNIKDLEMKTADSFRIVRENLSDMKLHFGQEIMRLDGEQKNILVELEHY